MLLIYVEEINPGPDVEWEKFCKERIDEAELIESLHTKEAVWKKTLKGMKEELLQNALNPKRIKGILWKEEN